MNRWRDAITRYQGAVPTPFAIYRAPIIGGGSILPFDVGVCSYDVKDLNTLRSIEELGSYDAEVKARIVELDTEFAGLPFDDTAREEYAALKEAAGNIAARITELNARKADLAALAGQPGRTEGPGRFTTNAGGAGSKLPENLSDLQEYRARTTSQEAMTALMRDGAMKLAEQATYPHERASEDRTVKHIHKLLATIDGGDEQDNTPAGMLARRILATGSQVYARAFGKMLSGQHLTTQEQAAIAVVGTTAAGGYAVPFTVDPTVIRTSDGAVNPLREMARVETITGNTWKGVTSAGIVVSRGAEAAEVVDNAPTFGQPEVTVQSVKTLIKFSVEADQDWPRLQAEMALILQDAKDDEEADSFINGSGTGVNPEGLIAGLDPASFVPTIDTVAPITLTLEDIVGLTGALPPRYRARAQWLGNLGILNLVSLFGAGAVGEGAVWRRGLSADLPGALLGRTARESAAMDADMTEGNVIAVYGDFRNFLIVDKAGMNIELIPHIVNGNGNPTGQRGLFAFWRNSSVILNDNAFRALVAGAVPS